LQSAISNAIGYAMHRSRSNDAMIRVYDEAGNVIETHGEAVPEVRTALPCHRKVAIAAKAKAW
jgi:hypothetical protein